MNDVQAEQEEWRIRPGASPRHVRAVMARRALMLNQLLPYDDPEHGYVNPLDSPEMKASIRVFMSDLDAWLAADDENLARRADQDDHLVHRPEEIIADLREHREGTDG